MVFVMSMVILMDVLKYFFHIDPARRERLKIRRTRARAKKKRRTLQQPKLALHFIYVDAPDNDFSAQVEKQIDMESRV